MIFFAQKSDNVCCFLRIISWEFPQFFDLKIVNKILPQRHGLSFAGEETLGDMVWVPFLYRFTVLLNSAGSNSSWSEFWSEFPHFMGMGGILGAICLFFSPIWRGGANFGWVSSFWGTFWGNLAGSLHFEGNFGWFSLILAHILGEILGFFLLGVIWLVFPHLGLGILGQFFLAGFPSFWGYFGGN